MVGSRLVFGKDSLMIVALLHTHFTEKFAKDVEFFTHLL
jgi:hypothetical protein